MRAVGERRPSAETVKRRLNNFEREKMSDPVSSSIDLIRYAIADQVRSLGGNDEDIDGICVSAAYAVWCWGLSGPQRG